MDTIQNNLALQRLVGRTVSQALVEGEVAPPAGKSAVKQVLHVSASITMGATEALSGRLAMDGTITLQVLYIGIDDGISAFSSVSVFKHTVELAAAEAGMTASARPELQTVTWTLLDERRIGIRAVVDIRCTVVNNAPIQTLAGIRGVSDLQVLSTHLEIPSSRPLGSSSFMLRENVPLPESVAGANEVLTANAHAEVDSVSVDEGKAAVEGRLTLDVLVKTNDEANPLAQVQPNIPFGQLAPLNDPMALTANASVGVRDLHVSVDPGEASLNVEATLHANIEGRDMQNVLALEDAYSPSTPFRCIVETLELPLAAQTVRERIQIRETVSLTEGQPPISRMLYAGARAVVTGVTAEENRVVVDGILFTRLIYICPENMVHAADEDVPFRASVAMAGLMPGQDVDASLYVQSVFATPVNNGADVKYSLFMEAQCYSVLRVSVVTGCEPAPAQENPVGFIVYFATQGETLWNIAKKFSVTRDDILSLNPNAEEATGAAGQKLLLNLVGNGA